MLDGRTQWMSLSAPAEQTSDGKLIPAPRSIVLSAAEEQKSSDAGRRVTLAHGSARPADLSMSQTAFG